MAGLHLLGRGGGVALGLDGGRLLRGHHEVVAELRLDGVGDLSDGQRERDLVELLDHLPVGELAEVAALR